MKVGIMSDTHDHLPNVRKAVAILQEAGVEHLLHAGDFVAPFVLPELAKLGRRVTGVFGNNDGERIGLRTRAESMGEIKIQPAFLELGGKRFAMVHEPDVVEALAASGLYDVVVYGHTHRADLRTVGKALVVNPGETCDYLTGRGSVVLLDTETMQALLVELI